MILIAHRGLMYGPDSERENTPYRIETALEAGFDVEVDVWWSNGRWWLGHDSPTTETTFNFLKTKGLWIHCKNVRALEVLSKSSGGELNYFWHQTDCYTLTSKNIPWIYPGKQLISTGICVLPEEFMNVKDVSTLDVRGICSDHVVYIREQLK